MKKIHRKIISLQAKLIRKVAKHVRNRNAFFYQQGYHESIKKYKVKKSGNRIKDYQAYNEDKKYDKEGNAADLSEYHITQQQAAEICIKQKDAIIASFYRNIIRIMDGYILPDYLFREELLKKFNQNK